MARPLSILVVDDQASTRTLIAEALAEDQDATVMLAQDGDQAFRMALAHRFDAIVCDVNMEPVDGLSFLRTLRGQKEPAIRDIPVIVMATTASRDVVIAAHQFEALAIMAKPVSVAMLKARLQVVRDAKLRPR
jgi:two-component system chemotaxis response regulator CheY